MFVVRRLNQKMNESKEDLIKIENKIRELEARIKKLEDWKLVHTSISEEKN
jgi:septal ring factor EnvC (AmiA/AmiB activator)